MRKKWNKYKTRWIILIAAVSCAVAIPLAINDSGSEAESIVEGQLFTVQRGDITNDISSAGNLSFCIEEDLAFDIAGTVEEVLVEVGDSVAEGQVLARLDSSEWEEELREKENNLLQAEINYKNAEIALDEAINPYTDEEIEEAEDELDQAEAQLRYDLKHGPESSILQSQEKVYQAQKTLDEMEEGGDEDDIAIKEMQMSLAEAQLGNAMDEVEDALGASLEVIAPFDGFITQVNVSGGDEILKGTVAVAIADPTRFEAELLVSETDIFDITLGGDASVQADAMTLPDLPAKVTYISPTATISSGVVNYEVTVELEALEAIRQQQQEAIQARQEEMRQALSSGELPEQLQEAVEQGQMTREQAEEIMQQMQQMEEAGLGQMSTLIPEDLELKEGLSVTVSILIEGASDVLLVPNGAITYSRGAAYVQVVSPEGVTEERSIQTGISDWQYTEITDGLSEGEQVVVPQTADGNSSTTSQQGFQGGMMMPGMGGGPPR
ncbi:MAG: HlyD family efflux transporter periplasmic adaptor subunit [Dehalococcoidales bacterium]|nr:HlyD family efflux transporter periplasmic adaptor subunit [Dehalococcoidales bacterium]